MTTTWSRSPYLVAPFLVLPEAALLEATSVPYIIVSLNKCEMVDEELLDLVEPEVRQLLSECGFPGNDLPVIRGSAWKALEGDAIWEEKILELGKTLDSYIPKPN